MDYQQKTLCEISCFVDYQQQTLCAISCFVDYQQQMLCEISCFVDYQQQTLCEISCFMVVIMKGRTVFYNEESGKTVPQKSRQAALRNFPDDTSIRV